MNNTVYEFYGDYWHGNPNRFNPEDENKHLKIQFKKLYEETINRENLIKSHGYNLITIWEYEFKQQIISQLKN